MTGTSRRTVLKGMATAVTVPPLIADAQAAAESVGEGGAVEVALHVNGTTARS